MSVSMLVSADDSRLARIRSLLEPDPALLETPVSKQQKWESIIFSAEQWEVEQPDGQLGRRDLVFHHGGAGVCALHDGCICLVRQYRVALGRMTLEIPAGKLDPGEDAALCAARELMEETGLVADRLVHIATTSSAPGFTNEKTRIFFAEGLSRHSSAPDQDEFVSVVWLPVEDMLAAVHAGLIEDAKTVVALLYAQLLRAKNE